MTVAANPLIEVNPGLMIWTIVCFLITLFVLKRYAFGPIQKTIDERRERIRQSIEEAERAREEARRLLEEHKSLMGQALEYEVANVVDPNFTMVAKVRKSLLPRR